MKNSIEHIWHFFHMIDSLDYPRHLIQIGVLVSDSNDGTYTRALELADERQYSRKQDEQYGRITIFNKDFAGHPEDLDTGGADIKLIQEGLLNVGKARHSFAFQKYRRALLAKSRTWLLMSTLAPEVDWVVWMDVDVIEYEKDMIQTLMGWSVKTGAQVIAPNCMWKSYNEMG